MTACSRSVVVDEKPYSMPPRTPVSFGSKNCFGNVAPLKPRHTLTACVSFDSLMTQLLIAWIVVVYVLPRHSFSNFSTRNGASLALRSATLYFSYIGPVSAEREECGGVGGG